MLARGFPAPHRTPDGGFVARQRAKGTPESAIARMGGWCLSDVQAIPHEPSLTALARLAAAPKVARALDALSIPDVVEILTHIAEQYGVTVEDILGHSHAQQAVEPRHEAMAVVFELNRYTLAQLGSIFNKTGNAVAFGLRRHYQRLRFRGPGRDW